MNELLKRTIQCAANMSKKGNLSYGVWYKDKHAALAALKCYETDKGSYWHTAQVRIKILPTYVCEILHNETSMVFPCLLDHLIFVDMTTEQVSVTPTNQKAVVRRVDDVVLEVFGRYGGFCKYIKGSDTFVDADGWIKQKPAPIGHAIECPAPEPTLLWWQVEDKKKKDAEEEVIALRNAVRNWHRLLD